MNLPCKDCITLAVCKAYQSKYPEAKMRGMFITIIESRCSTLSEYTRYRYKSPSYDTTTNVLNFFYGE